MVVQHNLQAMNSNRMLGITTKTLAGSTEKLSSGYKINRAADNAAGLAISEKMRKQIRGLTQASANAEDGISSVQTAEGGLAEVQDMLQRMNELAVQAANGTNSVTDRQYIQDEMDQLVTEIDRVAETTKFNEIYLLKGDGTKEESVAYTINYAVTYTINDGTNYGVYDKNAVGGGGTARTDGVEHKVNYVGTDNLYIVNAADMEAGNRSTPITADVIRKGDDVTKYLASTNEGQNGRLEGAYKDMDYAIFKSADATKLTVSADGTGKDMTYVDGLLAASATDSTGDAYILDTETNCMIRIAAGEDLSDYMDIDTSGGEWTVQMKDRYRLMEETKIDKHSDGSSCTDDSHGTSVGDIPNRGTSLATRIAPMGNTDINAAMDFKLDTSMKQLYDADGQEVSGVALRKYFDDRGNYKGGLFTDKQATKAVVNDDDPAASDLTRISAFITKNYAKVKADLNFDLHVGADSPRTNKITASIASMSAAAIGINKLKSTAIGIVDDTGNNATDAIDVIAEALQKVSTQRSALGAVQNRLEHTIKNLDNVVENTTSAESAIRDTDMADEMVQYSNANILSQAGQSMLAQANQANQGVLSLLG